MDWPKRLKAFILGLKNGKSHEMRYPPLCEPDDEDERWKYCLACSCLRCPYK